MVSMASESRSLPPAPEASLRPAPEVCIVVPTFNERDNVPLVVDAIVRVLTSCDWEVLFVDDTSPDGSAVVARAIGETDSRVRCLRRICRRGLAGACLEGMLASHARYLAVMDADLQHDETLLVAMLDCLRGSPHSSSANGEHGDGPVDLVVASRYLIGGSAAGLSKHRARLSSWSTALVQRALGIHLTDPMSGYFMIRRDAFERLAPAISTQG